MQCPMFVDYTRECVTQIEYVAWTGIIYCNSEKYKECPFFQAITNPKECCENIKSCKMFQHLALKDSLLFREINDKYCLRKDCVKCKRYQIRKTGVLPPDALMPDGSTLND